MTKIRITEDKLTSLIEESVYELLQEAETDEGLGHWLGHFTRNLRNKWNNFKQDYQLGQNAANRENAYYDSGDYYRQKGIDPNELYNFNNGVYRDVRKNFVTGRNNSAQTQFTDKWGNVTNSWNHGRNLDGTINTTNSTAPTTQSNTTTTQPENTTTVNDTTPTPNPDTTTQDTTTQNNTTTNTAPQPNSQRNQAKYKNIMSQQNKIKQQMQQISNYLRDKKNNHNFKLVNGEWITQGPDGNWYKASESGYDDIKTRADQYKNLQAKLNQLKQKVYTDKIIKESVDKVLKQYVKKKMR